MKSLVIATICIIAAILCTGCVSSPQAAIEPTPSSGIIAATTTQSAPVHVKLYSDPSGIFIADITNNEGFEDWLFVIVNYYDEEGVKVESEYSNLQTAKDGETVRAVGQKPHGNLSMKLNAVGSPLPHDEGLLMDGKNYRVSSTVEYG